MKRNDIIQALIQEAQDIEIPNKSAELKSVPITVIPLEIRQTKPKRTIFAPILRMMIVFVLSIGFVYSVLTRAETKVTIDINPSIEFTVNRYDKIVGVKAYNESGEEFIKKLNINYCSTEEAILRIITLADAMNYVNASSNAVLLSVSSLSDSKYEYESRIQKAFTEAFRQVGEEGEIYTVEPLGTDEQAASKRRISPAKFAFVREMLAKRMNRECMPNEVPEELLNSSVAELAEEMAN